MNGMDKDGTDCVNNDAFCGWVKDEKDEEKLTRLACIPKTLKYEGLPIEHKDECVKDLENNVTTCLCAVDNCNYQCNECEWKKSDDNSKILKCLTNNCEAGKPTTKLVASTGSTKDTETSGSVTKENADGTPTPTTETNTTNSDKGITKSNGKPQKENPDSPDSPSGCQRIAEPSQTDLIIWILATFVTLVKLI